MKVLCFTEVVFVEMTPRKEGPVSASVKKLDGYCTQLWNKGCKFETCSGP